MFSFFTDPVLRGPTIGSMLMCFFAALIGCLVFLQKRSLIGEALSHAAYPGVVMGVILAPLLFPFSANSGISILLGAFISSLIGLIAVDRMEKKLKITSDAALCLVLSLFFGVGVLIASRLQVINPLGFGRAKIYLFGQAATMVDTHIFIYGILTLIALIAIILLFRFLQILYFDPDFALAVGMPRFLIQGIVYLLLTLSVVVSMRSVGVVLISAMLIAPPAAARPLSWSLASFLTFSSLIGAACGFLGNYFSLQIPQWAGEEKLSLPTGPMIVLSATALCMLSLLFAPKTGLVVRLFRISSFRRRSVQENILKVLYKGIQPSRNSWMLWQMQTKKWIRKKPDQVILTKLGKKKAAKLIRLHRLWELYLVHMGQGVERVHYNAEEMEHILTPEIERELQSLFNHPKRDPHNQPIPEENS